MTKHVSSGGEATSSPRDAATESLPTSDAADAAAQRLSPVSYTHLTLPTTPYV